MPGVNCSVHDCGSCRRTKGIGIFKVPLAKDDAHKRWRDEWLGEIKKTREMDQDFRRKINDDKMYTCEKHFDLEDIEICNYVSLDDMSMNAEAGLSRNDETNRDASGRLHNRRF